MKPILKIVLGVLMLCFAAQLNFEFSEEIAALSISMISLGVLLLPFYLNKFESLVAITCYILLAIIGLPVMSSGLTGKNLLQGPTFGYLIGFVVAIYLLSSVEKKEGNVVKIAFLFLLGHIVILLIGVPYYYFMVSDVQVGQLIWPFLPGLAVKSLLGALLVKWSAKRDGKMIN